MPIEYIHRCDRCNEVMTQDTSRRRFWYRKHVTAKVGFMSHAWDFNSREIVLCSNCSEALFEFLKVPENER